MDPVPDEFGDDFLRWLRRATESAWQRITELSPADYAARGIIGAGWRRGTRWTGGLDDTTIADIEHRYEVHFPQRHRLFLQTLHSTTPWQRGADFRGDVYQAPGFYDWIQDEPQIRASMHAVVEGLLSDDLEGQYWHTSWGRCPERLDERRARIIGLVAAAPPLIPIHSHRYVIADDCEQVLSIVGTDIIIYGDSLRDYLLAELRDLLGDIGYFSPNVDRTHRPPFWRHFIWPE